MSDIQESQTAQAGPESSSSSSAGTQARSPPPPKAAMAPISRETRPMIVGNDSPEDPYPIHLEGAITRGFGRGARFLGIPTANLPDSSLDPLNQLGLTGIFFGFARIHPSEDTPLPTAAPTPEGSSPNSPKPDTHTADLPHQSPSKSKSKATGLKLDADAISNLPAHTAPYPANSDPETVGTLNKRLLPEDGGVWPMVMSVGYNPYFKNEKVTAEVHIIHSFQNDFYAHDMSVLVLGYIRPELDYVSKDALVNDINIDVKVALNSLARPEWAKYSTHPFLEARRGGSAGFSA